MIQRQGTSACFVGAMPRVSVDQMGRLGPLPHRSKLEALQKRGVGLTQDTYFVLLVLLCQALQRFVQSTSGRNVTLEENVGSLLLPLPEAPSTDHRQKQ